MEPATTQNYEIREDQIIQPLLRVLDEVTPKPLEKQHQSNTKAIADSLNGLFPEQKYDEKSIKKAKEILGELAGQFNDSELKDLVAQFQYLAESWLDDFERDIFDGLTLSELLHERRGL